MPTLFIQHQTITPAKPQAHTHSYGTDWKSDGSRHWHECSCGEKSGVESHNMKWIVDRKATVTEDGSKHEECTVCGTKDDIKTISSPKTATASYASVEYSGKSKTPVITVRDSKSNIIDKSEYSVKYSNNKYVGTATATVNFKDNLYSGSLTCKFKIIPKNTSITKLIASKKAFTASWKKQTTQTTGYQIRYSTGKTMSSSKTVTITSNKTSSKKISKLKSKKTYYVQVRTYKTVSGTKYYSSWSTAKKVKTK